MRYGLTAIAIVVVTFAMFYFRRAFELHGFGRAAFRSIDVVFLLTWVLDLWCVGLVAENVVAWSTNASRGRIRLRGILLSLVLFSILLGAFGGPFLPFDAWTDLRCSFVVSIAGLLCIPLAALWMLQRLVRVV